MVQTNVLNQKDFIQSCVTWKFTLDGEKVSVLQSFKITGSLGTDLLVEFDGDRLETFLNGEGKTQVKTKPDGKEGKHGILDFYSMSKRALKEHNARIVVRNITVDESGHPTFNLITIQKEKE